MYKTYYSKANIFWNTIEGVDRPNPNITDDYFNFILMENTGINFISWDSASVVVKDKDITYFKIENWSNEETPRLLDTKYLFASEISKVLKNGYELQLDLDLWMTYARYIVKGLMQDEYLPLVNRMSLYSKLAKDDRTKNYIRLGLTSPDKILDNQLPSNNRLNLTIKSENMNKEIYTTTTNQILTLQNKYWTDPKVRNLSPFGVYFVFLNKRTGMLDLYPVQINHLTNKETGQQYYLYQFTTSQREVHCWNSFFSLQFWLVRKSWVEDYGSDGFLGVYRCYNLAPLMNQEDIDETNFNPKRWEHREVTTQSSPKQVVADFMYFSIPSLNPKLITFDIIENVVSSDEENNFAKAGARLNTSLLIGNDLVKIKDLINDNSLSLKPKMLLSFNNAFIMFPYGDRYLQSNKLYTYGTQLPSYSKDYANQVQQANYRYDSGLAGRFLGVTGAALRSYGATVDAATGPDYLREIVDDPLSSSIPNLFNGIQPLKIVANIATGGLPTGTILGSLALLNSLKQNQRYRNDLFTSFATLQNTDTKNTYWNNQFMSIIDKEFGEQDIFQTQRDSFGYAYINHLHLKFEPDDIAKNNIMNIYNLYGYPVIAPVKLKDIFNVVTNPTKFYVEFNDGWITQNMRQLFRKYLPTTYIDKVILSAVITNIVQGIRIWFNNNPDYLNYDDEIITKE